jgi:hypothetical protein
MEPSISFEYPHSPGGIMKTTVLALVCFVASTLSLRAQAADASGTWDFTVTTQQGPTTAVMTLKKNGDKLAGTISSARGDVTVEGEQKDTSVSIWFAFQTSSGAMNITLTGTVAGDSMSGTMSLGGAGQAEWTAKRSGGAAAPAAPAAGQEKEKPSDVSGTWAVEVTTDGGSGTPTFTFKQDGEKLTGQYKGLFGEAPVTGTVKGDAITFAVELSVEGQTTKTTYTGTVEKDTMKGTVTFGDVAKGTFTGKKT